MQTTAHLCERSTIRTRNTGLLIGCSSHVLSHGDLYSLREYARLLPALELSFPLVQLPELSFVRMVESISGLHPVWRVTISDFETEREYFERESWFHFARALAANPSRHTLIVALERSSEYNGQHLDLLLELRDALSPFTCHFEFEHHSWSHAEPVLKGARASVVLYDAPNLPGIIKPITLPARRSIVRLLGRNKRTWFEYHAKERFEYHYSNTELSEITERIRLLKEDSDSVTIIAAAYPALHAIESARSLTLLLSK